MPFASIFIPDFPVQAVIRQDPDLQGKPVAILQGAPPLTKVFAVNQAARALGVEVGMTKLQVEDCTGVERRWRSPSQEATAQAALLDCAWTISPRVEEDRERSAEQLPDTVVLDITGCEKLFGSPEKIAADLKRVAAQVGLDANVAVAGNAQAAICAARGFSGITVIPPGREAAYLGTLPLSSLALPVELLETLHRWGIHTCAGFAALPEIAVIERFAQLGQRWQQLSRGADPRPLIPKAFPSQFEECMELEFPVDLLEPLLFVLNRLLDQLCARLRMHVLATREVQLTLTLQPGDLRRKNPVLHIRTLRLPVPATQSKFLLKLLQLDLQAHPPTASVTAVNIVVVPTRSRTRQLGLFLPLSPEPEALEITLARVQSIVGEGRVGSPALLDSHRPGGFQQNRFVLPEPSLNVSTPEHSPRAALRIYRPPLLATVQLENGRPTAIVCGNVRKPVLASAGPTKTNGDWWSENSWAREEWDVLIPSLRPEYQPDPSSQAEDTALYRIYKDLQSKSWFVEGIYD
ncbi:MAG: DNA polymerase Y family protein [Candidatus Acidiferrum sp.]